MFEKYDKKTFEELKKQHNIMVLVGNGFDVAVLKNIIQVVYREKHQRIMIFMNI